MAEWMFSNPKVWLLVASGALLFVPIAIQLFLARFDFTPLLWAGCGAYLLFALFLGALDLMRGFEAMAYVAPEMKATLVASGVSEVLSLLLVAPPVAILQLFGIGIAATVVRRAARNNEKRLQEVARAA